GATTARARRWGEAKVSREDLLKIIIGLASAFGGWVLAQLTSGLKTWIRRRKVLKLLVEELADLDVEIGGLYFYYARQLEIYGAFCISSETSVGLSNPIYREYYKDAVLSLNQRQRISYQLIHSLVDIVNLGLNELRHRASEIYAMNAVSGMTDELAKHCDAWGKAVKAQFMSCASLQWQVRFHLEHGAGPDLRPHTRYHEEFLIHLETMRKKADEFIANGKTIDRSKFDEIYNPVNFPKVPP
ncbi:MAG TPA: hypothetical protein VFI32_08670, partial [Rhodanobacteraceae bacterium]|nr:hypothetical protein [Rhodanobacteraceae bacterium]